jgi:hypothetical protein
VRPLLNYFPLLITLTIYLPASLLGLLLFRDREALEFILLITILTAVYFLTFNLFSRLYFSIARWLPTSYFHSPWHASANICILVYCASIGIAIYLTESIPLVIALEGGSVMDIANSRSLFLAGLEGHASVIRYLVFIMGRSILPLVLLAAFFYSHPSRHLLLCMMICLSMLSMEKSATIFVLLPIMLYFICYKFWGRAMGALCLLVITVGLMTFLATGGNERPTMATPATSETELNPRLPSIPPNMPLQQSMGNPLRFSLPHYLNSIHIGFGYSVDPTKLSEKAITLLNRMVWIPYITAYDWLGFQRTVLHNKLTYGRSISFIHLIYGEPKMELEKMVYVYEFGASPGGQGGSNTAFFVDAKLAFGWLGSIFYCLVFTFCAACIINSGSRVLIFSSVLCFFIASVSSLTATLLSGGLFIYVVLAFFIADREADRQLFPSAPRPSLAQ